eukprot:g3718.t1
MSFRELRNFTEILRALGYPRLVSVDNFRTPHFELVADCLHWMASKYDPNAAIPDNIETENDRVKFVTEVAALFMTKAGIKLHTKRLYAADGHAVRELLKVAKMLYAALRSNIAATADDGDADMSMTFELSSKLADLKKTRALGSEITEMGAKLYDLLKQEKDLRDARNKALRLLDALSSNMGSDHEQAAVRRKLHELVAEANDNVAGLTRQVKELESDRKSLTTKIKKKTADLERNEKRLRSLQTVRPAFMDEYEKLEGDLERHYELYLERFRNLDYLEHELDMYSRSEREKQREGENARKKVSDDLRKNLSDLNAGRFDDHGLDDDLDDDADRRNDKRRAEMGRMERPTAAAGRREGGMGGRVKGSMGTLSDSESEPSGLDSSDLSDSDGPVSMGGSRSGSLSPSGSDLDIDDDDDDRRSSAFSDNRDNRSFSGSGSDSDF